MNSVEFSDFQPRHPDFRANPYPVYERMRRIDPIHYRYGQGDWVLTRYDDIVAVLKQDRPPSEPAEAQTEIKAAALPAMSLADRLSQEGAHLWQLCLLLRNPPDHTRLRSLLFSTFCPMQTESLRQDVQTRADELIDRIEERSPGCVDIVQALANPLPMSVISDIMGIPAAMRSSLKTAVRDISHTMDMDIAPQMIHRSRLAFSVFAQAVRVIISRPDDIPENSLLATLLRANAEGKLSDEELLAHCAFVFLAGHSTTQDLISNGLLALLRHPDQLARLRAEPALIQTAVQECLRYDSPTQGISHFVFRDFELSNKLLRKGQTVHLMFGSANRDPERFSEPERFDIGRTPNPHLSFGYGLHYCLGVSLAVMVAEIAIGTLLRRLPRFTLVPRSVEWSEPFLLHGLKSLQLLVE